MAPVKVRRKPATRKRTTTGTGRRGRPISLTDDQQAQVRAMLTEGLSVSETARRCDLSRDQVRTQKYALQGKNAKGLLQAP